MTFKKVMYTCVLVYVFRPFLADPYMTVHDLNTTFKKSCSLK